MIDHKECRLGVCPIGKFAFSHEDAKVQKNAVMDKLRELGVDYVDIEEAVPDGLVRSKDQAAAVVAYLKEKQVDALFMPHCNFGTEDATGITARELDVPVLLWALSLYTFCLRTSMTQPSQRQPSWEPSVQDHPFLTWDATF